MEGGSMNRWRSMDGGRIMDGRVQMDGATTEDEGMSMDGGVWLEGDVWREEDGGVHWVFTKIEKEHISSYENNMRTQLHQVNAKHG